MIAGLLTTLLPMILPTILSLVSSWLQKSAATQKELDLYNSFVTMLQGKGLISANLSIDYENQKPPDPPQA